VSHCVRTSFDTYRDHFHDSCRTFRFGDRFLSASVLRQAEQLGARFDLTCEPGEPESRGLVPKERSTGKLPSYEGMPEEPFRPSPEDFRKPAKGADAGGLWIIPLTSGDYGRMRMPGYRIFRRLNRTHPVPTGFRALKLWEPPGIIGPAIRKRVSENAPGHLAFAVRSDLPTSPDGWRNFEENLEGFLSLPRAREMRWQTPTEWMQERGLARTRA
jgi:hypothetical protein